MMGWGRLEGRTAKVRPGLRPVNRQKLHSAAGVPELARRGGCYCAGKTTFPSTTVILTFAFRISSGRMVVRS